MAIPVSNFKYFEAGFLTIGSSTNNPYVIGLTDISLDFSYETEDTLTFESNRAIQKTLTTSSFTASASGKWTNLSGETYFQNSGQTRVVGGQGADAILEAAKAGATNLVMTLKLDTNNYQTASVVITSFSVSATAGSQMEYSFELAGTSELVKSGS